MNVEYEPEHDFREALTKLDLREIDLIVTPAADAAEWAKTQGYAVLPAEDRGVTVYEIWPGDHR